MCTSFFNCQSTVIVLNHHKGFTQHHIQVKFLKWKYEDIHLLFCGLRSKRWNNPKIAYVKFCNWILGRNTAITNVPRTTMTHIVTHSLFILKLYNKAQQRCALYNKAQQRCALYNKTTFGKITMSVLVNCIPRCRIDFKLMQIHACNYMNVDTYQLLD